MCVRRRAIEMATASAKPTAREAARLGDEERGVVGGNLAGVERRVVHRHAQNRAGERIDVGANRVVGLSDAHHAGERRRRPPGSCRPGAVDVQRRVGPVIDECQVRVDARRIRDTGIEVGDSEDRRAVSCRCPATVPI